MRTQFSASSLTVFAYLIVLLIGCQQDEISNDVGQNLPPVIEASPLTSRLVTPPAELTIEGLPGRYQFLYGSGTGSEDLAKVKEGMPFTEIQFERTPCLGACPSYVVTLKSNGTAEYVGLGYVPKMGIYSGEIDPWNYARLCLAIEKFKLVDGPRRYSANWTDDATAIIRLTRRDSDTAIEISDYGGQGPIELWTVFKVVDALASEIKWIKWTPDGAEVDAPKTP